jgi:hypothetical protein
MGDGSEVLPEIRNTVDTVVQRPSSPASRASGSNTSAGFWSERSSTLSSSLSVSRASASITSGWSRTIRTLARRAPTPISRTTTGNSARMSIDRGNSCVEPNQAPSSTAARNLSPRRLNPLRRSLARLTPALKRTGAGETQFAGAAISCSRRWPRNFPLQRDRGFQP